MLLKILVWMIIMKLKINKPYKIFCENCIDYDIQDYDDSELRMRFEECQKCGSKSHHDVKTNLIQ
jgi:hypothetical protein